VTKMAGSQGGHHVFVAARLHGPNLRDEMSTTKLGYTYAPLNVEVEVVAAGRVVSRSVSMHSIDGVEKESVDLVSLFAYVTDDLRGDVTISVKVATEDKTKWATGTRHLVVD
jgi:hypothetical protein